MKLGVLKAAAAVMHATGLLVFPSICKRCTRMLDRSGEKVVCADCLASLRARRGPVCERCGRFLDSAEVRPLCLSCLMDPPPYDMHRSGGVYSGSLKDMILLMKYRGYPVLGRLLAGFLYDGLREDAAVWENADTLVPVPLHPKRERERGFNQSRIIAQGLSHKTGIPVSEKLLVKTRNVPPQTSLEAGKRAENVRGAYQARQPEKITGKTVVLVDDVCTTGSTLMACGTALLEAKPREVRAVTLARA